MIDYIEAGKIRRQFPSNLSRQDIDCIITKWSESVIDKIDMLQFSGMMNPNNRKLNISELELLLRAKSYFNLKELEKSGSDCVFDLLALVCFENLVGYRNPFEIEEETYKLRLEIGEEFLAKWKELNPKSLINGFKKMREIRAKVNLKYKAKPHRWEKTIDKLVDKYL